MTKKTVLTVGTQELVGLLTDVGRSAGKDATLPMVEGIMLHVGSSNGAALVATATDRFTLGQGYISATGSMPHVWLNGGELKQIMPLLRPFARRSDTTLDITVTGREVTLSQNPLPGMANVSIHLELEGNPKFPDVNKFMSKPTEASADVPVFAASKLAVPMAVAVRRKENLRVVSHGAEKPAWVYVGDRYRCLVMPMRGSAVDTTVCPWFEVPMNEKEVAA